MATYNKLYVISLIFWTMLVSACSGGEGDSSASTTIFVEKTGNVKIAVIDSLFNSRCYSTYWRSGGELISRP